MKTIKTKTMNLQDAEKEMVLNTFLETFDKEYKEEIFSIDADFSQDGFAALADFHKEFNKEVHEQEIILHQKLTKGVITIGEMEELENIALLKYRGIKLEEVSDFYKFSNRKEREKLVVCLSEELV
jgi:hypothetical protein